jgi:hypothetical protein
MAPVHSCAIGRLSTFHDAGTQRCEDRSGARGLHFPRAMPDPDTSRIPREELLGLLSSASNIDQERITAPMPVARLDELLAPEQSPHGTVPELELHLDSPPPPEMLVRFKNALEPIMSLPRIMIVSFALTLALGLLLVLLV